MAGDLDVQGVNASELYTKITGAGVTPLDAKLLIGSLLIDFVGRRPRTFNYVTPFPSADGACTSSFVRTFLHQDWVDGESVVQAEETTGEIGFNRRLHEIEADLDALGADVALAFTCLADMRATIRALLDELRGEINRINVQLVDEGRTPLPTPLRPDIEFVGRTKVQNVDKYILREGDQFRLVDFAVGPVINPPGSWVDKIDKSAFVDVLAKATETIRTTPELDAAIRGGATAEDLRTKFADVEVATTPQGDSVLLGDVLTGVGPDTTFHDAADPAGAVLSAAIRTVSAEPAAELRDTVLKTAARNQSTVELADAAPTVLTDVSTSMANKLQAAGVNTVDSLARSTPDALLANLTAAGVTNVDSAAVTRAIISARVARNIRIGG